MAEDTPKQTPLSELNKEVISSFAYRTGKEIETFIQGITNGLEDKNKNLEALILSFDSKLNNDMKDFATKLTVDELWVLERYRKMYKEHFNIIEQSHGSISKQGTNS